MKNVITVVAAVTTIALSNIAFAAKPVGAAMVSTKIAPASVATANKAATTEVAAKQTKAFMWGSVPSRTQVNAERVVKAQNLVAKPSVISWPGTAGGTTMPSRKDKKDK